MQVGIITRKIDATDTDGEYIAAKASTGETAKIPYPYREGLDGREAHEKAARALSVVADDDHLVMVKETACGYAFHARPHTA